MPRDMVALGGGAFSYERGIAVQLYMVTSLMRKRLPLGPYKQHLGGYGGPRGKGMFRYERGTLVVLRSGWVTLNPKPYKQPLHPKP